MKLSNLLKAAAIAGIVGAVLNTVVFFIARAANMVNDSIIIRDGQPLKLLPVVLGSIVPAFIAALLLFVLSKFTKKPVAIFIWISVVFFLVSMMGPFGTPGLPMGMRITLAVMHIAPAAATLYFLRKAVGDSSTTNAAAIA